jgi:aminoglycoside phosphotransferase family enzyme/predicted kinase
MTGQSSHNEGPTSDAEAIGAPVPAWQDVVAFLSRPDSYPTCPPNVSQIETHISIVFLAGDRAYKIKKPVAFSFLDHTTLCARYRACLNELRVNRRTAPQLYLGLVPITFDARHGLALGGPGQPVEWVVEMQRFAQDCLYADLLARGQLGRDDFAHLAREIWAFHARTDRRLKPGAPEAALRRLIGENARDLERFPELFGPDDVTALTQRSQDRLSRLAPLLRRRALAGLVRHGHGDLHLANIVRLNGRPVLFDAVEFNDDIATRDILDDLAFLLMDLWASGARAAANIVLNAYLAADGGLGNLDGLAALPLYMSARAGIRAKAAAFSGRNDEAALYFALAQQVLSDPEPVMIAIGGLSGSGKSTLARAMGPDLGRAPGALVLRSDVERKLLFRQPETEPLGAEAYAPPVTGDVYRQLAKKASAGLAAGQAVLVDAVFARPEERQAMAQIAKARGAKFLGIWLDAPAELLVSRVESRQRDASDANAGVVRDQLDYDVGPMNWHRLDASGGAADVGAAAMAWLKSQGVAVPDDAVGRTK